MRKDEEAYSPEVPHDLSTGVVNRLAPLIGLVGGDSAERVRAEVNGQDAYFWHYWRWMAWIVVGGMLFVIGGVLVLVAAGSDVVSGVGFSLIEAAFGCALLSGLYGARLSACQWRASLSKSFPALFKPRSAEVVTIFAAWLLLQVVQLVL